MTFEKFKDYLIYNFSPITRTDDYGIWYLHDVIKEPVSDNIAVRFLNDSKDKVFVVRVTMFQLLKYNYKIDLFELFPNIKPLSEIDKILRNIE